MLTTYSIDEGAPEGSEVSIGDFSAQVHFGNEGTSKSDYSNINDTINTGVSLDNYLVDSTETSKSNITLNIYLHAQSETDTPQDIPDYADVWIEICDDYEWNTGGWNDWKSKKVSANTTTNEGLMTVKTDGSGHEYLSITLTGVSLNVGEVLYTLYFNRKADEYSSFDWADTIEGNSFTVSKYDKSGCTYTLDVISYHDDLSTWFPETLSDHTIDITVAIKDTGSSSGGQGGGQSGGQGGGQSGSTGSSTTYYLQYKADGNYDSSYQTGIQMSSSSGSYDQYATVSDWNPNTDFLFKIGNSATDSNGIGYSSSPSWSADNYYLGGSYADLGLYLSTFDSGYFDSYSSLTVILSFSFSSYGSSTSNIGYLISAYSFQLS